MSVVDRFRTMLNQMIDANRDDLHDARHWLDALVQAHARMQIVVSNLRDDCLQESPQKKREWLAEARRRVPVGSRVRVRKSDLTDYVGATGEVVEHEVGDIGEWPGVVVRFDKTTRGATRDLFYCDGSDEDEIEVIKMSDPEDKIDQHRDEALNALVKAIEATGGIGITSASDGGTQLAPIMAPASYKLGDAYINACKALGLVPLIDGKRRPKIFKVTIQVERSVNDELSDDENDVETAYINEMTKDLPDNVEVAVVDCNGVYLYDAHREV